MVSNLRFLIIAARKHRFQLGWEYSMKKKNSKTPIHTFGHASDAKKP